MRGVADRFLGADLAWSLSLIVVVMLLLGSQRCGTPGAHYQVGDVAPAELVARHDFQVEDVAATEVLIGAARAEVPDVYVHDAAHVDRVLREVERLFVHGRGDAASGGLAAPGSGIPRTYREPAMRSLERYQWPSGIEDAITESLEVVMNGLVIGNRALLAEKSHIVVVHVPGRAEERLGEYSSVLDLDAARERVRGEVRRRLDLPAGDETALAALAAWYVHTNLAFDPEGTERRRDVAAADVVAQKEPVRRGTVLAREGQRLDETTIRLLAAEREAAVGRMETTEFLALLAMVSTLAFFLYRYCHFHQRAFRRVRHLHALMVLMALATMITTWAILWISRLASAGLPPPYDDAALYVYLVPVAAGAMLITLLANGRIAMVYAGLVAVLFGALTGWHYLDMLWALLVQFAGVYAMTTYRARAALLRAGLVVGLAAAAACIVVRALDGSLQPPIATLYGSLLAFIGGAIGTGLVMSFSLPILEGLFNVLTEIRLLELSSLDNPVLSQLALKAPGSYNHSLLVGTLAEEGAKAVGANALFCRVAAFYHDIGKMIKPEYFVENQGTANPHDKLSPSMSALVIASHVKDGIRMARDSGVPEQIVDIIPQHHGTRKMTFFLEKARAETDRNHGEINEQDFRYPGPRPQTREAAIFMLADAVEAAARTVDEPTPVRLREMIRKITEGIALDGQLDECDLTFADIDRIQSAFVRALSSVHHRRVDYPGYDFRNGDATTAPELPDEGD